ncbi:nucleotidyltransferase domain-containing protein [Thermoanaerobacterium thermosaccharolyticum]|uniref:nucleotidyltransferase domain-containing protein n=1 Tax=Thermoanaerobacterium thermosaccharolyticum TaxID=1517 RepID=UPI003DA7FE69
MNDTLRDVKEYLIKKYNCHSIILYGSYVKGDFTEESDIDLLCFCDNPVAENDTIIINGRQLDAWIYETGTMDNFTQFLHVRGGKILLDERNKCDNFLKEIDKQFKKGPEQLTAEKKCFLKNWLFKMFNRAQKGDIEGNYRYHWLLVDSLEIYFNIKGLWYLGPKKSLKWLYENDRDAYNVFDNALKVNADIADVEKLIEFIRSL